MPNYTRAYIPGGTYFLLSQLERRRRLLVEHIELLKNPFRTVKQQQERNVI